jgi:predicted phosphodiesterase
LRLLVLSDIHANQTALDAVLAAAEGRWDRVACLGDMVGYGPDPNEVIERVQKLGAVTIRGNHDKAGSGLDDASDFNPVARSAVEWTRRQLRPENAEYLRQLPQGPLEIDGVVLIHGALKDEDQYVFAPADALDGLIDSPSPVTFFGHTHMQGGFSFRDNTVEVIRVRLGPNSPSATLELDAAARYLLNPGSIGQPRDGDPRAAFVIAELDRHAVDFWRVPYDLEAVQQRMTKAGLPEALILRLAFGR